MSLRFSSVAGNQPSSDRLLLRPRGSVPYSIQFGADGTERCSRAEPAEQTVVQMLAAGQSQAEQHREGGELWQPEERADPMASTVEWSVPAGG